MSTNYAGQDLIFIISQPRSGSTLLQRVLFGHPDVQTSAETWLMLHPAYSLKKTGLTAEYGTRFAYQAVQEFLENYAGGTEVYLDAIREWARVIYGHVTQENHRVRFLDKTPRYFYIIPELYRLFPEAKFVFLLRNPMAVLASELNTYVKGNWPVLGVFKSDLVSAPGWILEGIDLMGDDAYVVHYERFVSDPDNSLRALCDYLELDYHEEMLDYSRTPKPVGRFNDLVGIDQHTAPSTMSVDKWKGMVEDDQSLHFAQRYLETLGRGTMNGLGYDYDDVHKTLHGRVVSTRKLYPWSIAIQPESEWTYRQHFVSDLFLYRKNKGWVRGTPSAVRKHSEIVARAILRALSSPDIG
jgi:hypothetical protein